MVLGIVMKLWSVIEDCVAIVPSLRAGSGSSPALAFVADSPIYLSVYSGIEQFVYRRKNGIRICT